MNSVYFNAGNFSDFRVNCSQLQNISFGGSEFDNIKIKNSTLEKITFMVANTFKTICRNGLATSYPPKISDYNEFLKEIN